MSSTPPPEPSDEDSIGDPPEAPPPMPVGDALQPLVPPPEPHEAVDPKAEYRAMREEKKKLVAKYEVIESFCIV